MASRFEERVEVLGGRLMSFGSLHATKLSDDVSTEGSGTSTFWGALRSSGQHGNDLFYILKLIRVSM